MTYINQLVTQLLRECEQEGHVELWSIIWVVRYTLNGNDYPKEDRSDPIEVRRITLAIVRSMLESGKIQIGSLSDDGTKLQAWPTTIGEAIKRISAKWDSLGHEPDMESNAVILFPLGQRENTVVSSQ